MKIGWFVLVTCSLLPRCGLAQASPDMTLSAKAEAIPEAPSIPISPPNAVGQGRLAPTQRFECSARFTLDECKQSMVALTELLNKYRAVRLGEWKWVLVRSEDWTHLLLARGISPSVPAVTILESRATLFDEALVAGPAGRVSDLMDTWHLGRSALLDVAVRHELGHALCRDTSERNAERVARLLEQNKPVSCVRARQRGLAWLDR
jgi:hypothetical protein